MRLPLCWLLLPLMALAAPAQPPQNIQVDGLSLVWSPASLRAAAALLQPALHGPSQPRGRARPPTPENPTFHK
ncbi:hypothetical protein HUJ04_000218 [Dendroctonus ponderosae]|nr:hypothetical protein HUJ04_000218 [Dendroctonus ponderosae]KAH1003171.1 hypothetical protein HUJ05_011111 [Dendroctonus ponderosae]